MTAALLLAAATVAGSGRGSTSGAAGAIDRAVVHFDDSVTSGSVRPTPFEAPRDFPPTGHGCHADLTDLRSRGCVFGTTGRSGPIVLLGDSHASQWMSAVLDLAAARSTSVQLFTHSGCPAAQIEVPSAPAVRKACDAWREDSLRRIEQGPRPSMVVVTNFNGYLRGASERARAWQPVLSRLTALGVPVIYLADTPQPDQDIATCMSGALDDWSRCAFDRSRAVRTDLVAEAVAGGVWPNTYLVDLNELICPTTDARCAPARGGILLYRDASHLTDTAVQVLSPQLVAAVQAQIP